MGADPFVSYLNLQHYNPIEVPHEQFDPLTVLGGSSPTELQPLGTLEDLLVPGTALPTIARDDPAPAFSNRRGKTVDANAGLNLLGRLLSAFGGTSATASAEYKDADSFEYLYLGVRHDFVLPLRVLPVFQTSNLQTSALDAIAAMRYAYLVTDTLKSNEFGIVAYDGKGGSIQLDADAIQNAVGAHAGIKVDGESGSLVTYTGDAYLRFAFRALRLTYDSATRHVALQIDSTFLVSRAVGEAPALPADAYELIAAGQAIDVGSG